MKGKIKKNKWGLSNLKPPHLGVKEDKSKKTANATKKPLGRSGYFTPMAVIQKMLDQIQKEEDK